MHGLGNDFVVIDARSTGLVLNTAQLVAMANRRTGIGCDQFALLRPSSRADVFADMYNADGSTLRACGNATRCIAALMMQESGKSIVTVETVAGLLTCADAGHGLISVDMGEPITDWQKIPLREDAPLDDLPVTLGPLAHGSAVSMGNPHAVFFVSDVEAIDLPLWGPQIEHHPLFPDRVNVELVTIQAPDRLRMRVWERGTGITMACGTGACASLVAAARRGLCARKASLVLDGGILQIEWRAADNHVIMSGPWAQSFEGVWPQ